MSDIVDFVLNPSEEYTAKQLYDIYGDHLPLLVSVCKGFYGNGEENSFSTKQVLRLHDVRQQQRALVHDRRKKTLTVPLDYKHRFCVRDRAGSFTLREIAERYTPPVKLSLYDSHVLRIMSEDSESLKSFTLVKIYTQTFFVANTIVNGSVLEEVIPVPLYLKEVTFSPVIGARGRGLTDSGRALIDRLLHPLSVAYIDFNADCSDKEMVQLSQKPLTDTTNLYANIQQNIYINITAAIQTKRGGEKEKETSRRPVPPVPLEDEFDDDYLEPVPVVSGARHTDNPDPNIYENLHTLKKEKQAGEEKLPPLPPRPLQLAQNQIVSEFRSRVDAENYSQAEKVKYENEPTGSLKTVGFVANDDATSGMNQKRGCEEENNNDDHDDSDDDDAYEKCGSNSDSDVYEPIDDIRIDKNEESATHKDTFTNEKDLVKEINDREASGQKTAKNKPGMTSPPVNLMDSEFLKKLQKRKKSIEGREPISPDKEFWSLSRTEEPCKEEGSKGAFPFAAHLKRTETKSENKPGDHSDEQKATPPSLSTLTSGVDTQSPTLPRRALLPPQVINTPKHNSPDKKRALLPPQAKHTPKQNSLDKKNKPMLPPLKLSTKAQEDKTQTADAKKEPRPAESNRTQKVTDPEGVKTPQSPKPKPTLKPKPEPQMAQHHTTINTPSAKEGNPNSTPSKQPPKVPHKEESSKSTSSKQPPQVPDKKDATLKKAAARFEEETHDGPAVVRALPHSQKVKQNKEVLAVGTQPPKVPLKERVAPKGVPPATFPKHEYTNQSQMAVIRPTTHSTTTPSAVSNQSTAHQAGHPAPFEDNRQSSVPTRQRAGSTPSEAIQANLPTRNRAGSIPADKSKTPLKQEAPRVEEMSMEEVQNLLGTLNMGKYAEMFREKQVDGELLRCLDDEVLKHEFHMESKLDRLKLMNFITKGHLPK